MDFVAFDFETANSTRNSAVSIALTVVRNNIIVDEFYSLINPEVEFNWRNTQINGIHKQDIIDAPTFIELWPTIEQFFSPNKLVIAHNASFDNSVLKASLLSRNLTLPSYQSLDTLRVVKKLLPNLENHKLDTVTDYLDIKLKHHHNALDDSVAAANILLASIEKFGSNAMISFIKQV